MGRGRHKLSASLFVLEVVVTSEQEQGDGALTELWEILHKHCLALKLGETLGVELENDRISTKNRLTSSVS